MNDRSLTSVNPILEKPQHPIFLLFNQQDEFSFLHTCLKNELTCEGEELESLSFLCLVVEKTTDILPTVDFF
jgi:hypothetical protein